MIDILYILVLALSAALLIAQELTIRSQNKLIALQHDALRQCEPIITAVVLAVKEARSNGKGKATVEFPKDK
jgi:hypothetical protein